MSDLPAEFKNPSAEYRGVTLWMLNDKLEKKELHRQLEAFHTGGWGAVIARTFPGLLTEYLSDEWMEMIQNLVGKAGELGMRAWLQAAYMPGAVPGLAENIQYRGLKAVSKNPADKEAALTGILATSSYGGTGEGFEVLTEDDGYTYQCGRMPEVLDLLNGSAVTAYLDNAYKKPWYDRIGDQFGKTIEAVWVDEPHFRPQLVPWSTRLPETFKERFGYDIIPHIPSLFFETGDWQKIRHHYWRVIVHMFMNAYFGHVGTWCAGHDVKFSGHLMGEDSLHAQIAWTGACMQAYEHMQLPGVDHLTMSLTWPTGKKFILTPKQATSVANQLGKEEVLAEIYAVSSHRITFRERKRIFNWMAVLGITYRCNHAAFYSMRGLRKRMYVPHLGCQQPWWSDNRLLGDYCARVSWFLRQGIRVADILVLHPVESGYCVYDPVANRDRERSGGDISGMNTRLIDLCDHLLSLQRDFEFGDEALMAKHGDPDGDELIIGRARYRTVILPDLISVRRTTLDLLNAFVAGGGTVLAAGSLPSRVDGMDENGRTREDSAALETLEQHVVPVQPEPDLLAETINRAVPRRFSLTGGPEVRSVWTQLRRTGSTTGLFLVNTSPDETVTAGLKLTGSGSLAKWDLETGTKTDFPCRAEDDGITVPLTLAPDESLLLMRESGETLRELPDAAPETVRTVSLAGRPAVRRLWPNALPLETARYRKGGGEWSAPLPVVMIQDALTAEQYHGPVSVEYVFDVTDAPSRAALTVETPEIWSVTVNDRPVDTGTPEDGFYIDPAFRSLDITGSVTAGPNTVILSGAYHAIDNSTRGLQRQHEVHDGTEIEAVYITGDFAVDGKRSADPPAGCHALSARTITTESGTTGWDAAADGYPFFAGRIVLSDTVTLDAPGADEKVFLRLADLQAPTALVRVNGKSAGQLAWPPLRLDITELVQAGENLVEIEFATSLRNVLGPFHRAEGEPDSCWRSAWNDLRGAEGLEHADEQSDWTDAFMVIKTGTSAAPRIETVSAARK